MRIRWRSSRRTRLWERLGEVGVLLLAWGVRMYRLDAQPVWLDEAFSVWMASHVPRDVVFWTRTIDQHPPLYYLLLHGWMKVWGDTEWAIRFFSLVGGWLAVAVGMAVAREVGGRRLMFISGVWLALSSFAVWYAQEARMYAWVLCAVGISLWGGVRLWRNPEDRVALVALVVGSALAAWLHNVALLFPALVFPAVAFRLGRQRFKWVLGMGGLFLGLWGIWLPALVGQSQGVWHRFWVPSLSLYHVAVTGITCVCPYFPVSLVGGGCTLLWGVLSLWGGWHMLRDERLRARGGLLLVLAALVAPGVVVIISVVRPILVARVLIWIILPVTVLSAWGSLRLPGKGRWILVGVLVSAQILSLYGYFTRFHKEAWDEVAAYVARHALPHERILFEAGWVQLPFDYYFRAYNLPLEEHGLPADPFVTGELEPPFRVSDIPRLNRLIAGEQRVWVVLSHVPYTDPHHLVEKTLRSRLRCQEHRFGDIRLLSCYPR